MKSIPRSIYDLFDTKHRYVVPLFQRQYVWSKDVQWEPLWDDILSKTLDRLDNRDSYPHFMGAMVFEQFTTFGNEVPAHTVIDGQQRLTTLQLFLTAFRNVAAKFGQTAYADDIDRHIFNTGLIDEKNVFEGRPVERFKIWPTKSDQIQFRDVIESRSRDELEAKHPPVYERRKLKPRPRMVEAYLFFENALESYMTDPELSHPVDARTAALSQTLNRDLQVVSIELEEKDDAQVIFETLNARGQPLLPSDLLRNFVFRRAELGGENQDLLYESHWKIFEDEFWRVPEKQGRLKRARIDLFMQHFLALKKASDVNVGHLFEEYKLWMKNANPYETVDAELTDLVRYARAFHQLSDQTAGSVFGEFGKRLDILDVRTIYPLLLHLLADAEMGEEDLVTAGRYLESYLIRRIVCGKTTKNYNKSFLQVMRELQINNGGINTLRDLLLGFTGEAVVWPNDEEFETGWLNQPVYETLGPRRVELILHSIEDKLPNALFEDITINSKLTVEHIMPQTWETHWALPAHSSGEEAGEPVDKRAVTRDKLVQTFGNLTLLVQPLNSAVSNGPFETKKETILTHSVLRLNGYLREKDRWDEDDIRERGKYLFEIAKRIWPHPTSV
jgi:uncharacterized protein with ParB-like and HNH nuclease domain